MEKNFYQDIIDANEGINAKDIRSVFIWYNLLSVLLPFQLIFIIVNAIGVDYYALTMCSVLFVILTDSIIKYSIEKDNKNFMKFHKHISLVKLWVIPLMFMGIVTTIALLVTTFGLI